MFSLWDRKDFVALSKGLGVMVKMLHKGTKEILVLELKFKVILIPMYHQL